MLLRSYNPLDKASETENLPCFFTRGGDLVYICETYIYKVKRFRNVLFAVLYDNPTDRNC